MTTYPVLEYGLAIILMSGPNMAGSIQQFLWMPLLIAGMSPEYMQPFGLDHEAGVLPD